MMNRNDMLLILSFLCLDRFFWGGENKQFVYIEFVFAIHYYTHQHPHTHAHTHTHPVSLIFVNNDLISRLTTNVFLNIAVKIRDLAVETLPP